MTSIPLQNSDSVIRNTGPLQAAAGFSPGPNSPQPSSALATSAASSQPNPDVFQAGADAVLGNPSGVSAFNVMRYPSEVGTAEVPHYVMFYVNVRKSELSSSEQQSNISSVNFDPSSNNSVSSETSAQQGLSAAATVTGGAQVGRDLANTLGVSFLGAPFAVFAASAALASTVKAEFSSTIQTNTKVLIKDVIALYLSGKPSVQYSASWADVDIGLAGRLGEAFGRIENTVTELADDPSRTKWDVLKGAGSATLQEIMSGQGIAANLILKSADKSTPFGNFGAALQASAAVVPNPFKAQLFHTMGFRTFSFDYTFLPKNQAEYDQVKKIIYTFKRYMHPTTGFDKYLLQYPAEWSIAYYYKGAVSSELFKIANCALTGCKVEYGGTDFTTFKRIPGGPTEISMQLSFVETELLTRDRVEAGY